MLSGVLFRVCSAAVMHTICKAMSVHACERCLPMGTFRLSTGVHAGSSRPRIDCYICAAGQDRPTVAGLPAQTDSVRSGCPRAHFNSHPPRCSHPSERLIRVRWHRSFMPSRRLATEGGRPPERPPRRAHPPQPIPDDIGAASCRSSMKSMPTGIYARR